MAKRSDGLVSVDVPRHCVKVVEDRLSPLLAARIRAFTVKLSIDEQMRMLAFDAYTQGLLDGAQIGQRPDVRNVILGEAA